MIKKYELINYYYNNRDKFVLVIVFWVIIVRLYKVRVLYICTTKTAKAIPIKKSLRG